MPGRPALARHRFSCEPRFTWRVGRDRLNDNNSAAYALEGLRSSADAEIWNSACKLEPLSTAGALGPRLIGSHAVASVCRSWAVTSQLSASASQLCFSSSV